MSAFTDALSAAASLEALPWLLFAGLIAGLVRGFAGFGSGLVFMPMAGAVLPPAQAVAVIVLIDFLGSLPNLPPAVRKAELGDLRRLWMGLLPGVILGVWLLFWVPVDVFRWAVSLIAFATVAALMSGWKWTGGRGLVPTLSVGFFAGLFGGAAAVPGPPAVFFYLASNLPVERVRATLATFIITADVVLLALLGLTGRLTTEVLALSAMVLVPFILGSSIGAWLFNPSRAKIYRVGSWVVISASALYGLPLW